MPHGSERGYELTYAGTAAFAGAEFRDDGANRIELAQAGADPIDVPRPEANQTVTVTVVTGRPLKLGFSVDDVKGREIVRDDLVLDFDNGGKVVLKDYMHAFGQLGEHRTTIIQADGKHYAFTDLLAPSAGPGTQPARPGTGADVVIAEKPPAGEKQIFKLATDKPMALNFTMSDVARSQVDKDGNLVLTFKDKAVLVLEGYSALKDSADIALYFAKGDKIALGDLAPGAGPDAGAEGGHLFSAFDGGNLGHGLDHLGALGPLPFGLFPPPGPPGSRPPGDPPPGGPPPGTPPPPDIPPPPEVCKPMDCAPPVCEPKVALCQPKGDCNFDSKDHGDRGGHGKDHGRLTWVKGADCVVAGDAHWAGALRGKDGDGAAKHVDAHSRGWVDGHDGGPGHHGQHMVSAHWHSLQDSGLVPTGENGGWHHGRDEGPAPGAHAGQFAHLAGDPGHGGHETHAAPVSHHELFGGGHDSGARDSGTHAPAHSGDHGAGAHLAAIHFAAAHDVGAVVAHAESHAPQVQNQAHHNVMGH